MSVQLQSNIEGMMMNLMKQLALLAPHPDRPHYKGPLFVQVNPHCKPAAEYEGMLGSMVFESLLGPVFAAAVTDSFGSWAGTFDWSNAADITSEYLEDRAANNNVQTISPQFNSGARRHQMMLAYLRDLPRRKGIENMLAYYQRKLNALRKNSASAPALQAA